LSNTPPPNAIGGVTKLFGKRLNALCHQVRRGVDGESRVSQEGGRFQRWIRDDSLWVDRNPIPTVLKQM